MAILGLITVDEISVATIDTDPTLGGYDLPVGSIAVLVTNGQLYVKRSATITDWKKAGTVNSVDITVPTIFNVSGSPITDTGTVVISLATQAANLVWAGPTTGSPADPTFRSLVASDIPSLSYVTSVALSLPSFITVSGSPVTSSGTLTGTLANQVANSVFSGPSSGGAAAPTFRSLVSDDIPSLDTSKLTTGTLPIARGGTNSGTALNDNRIIISSGGALVENAALTPGSVLFAATTTGLPTQSNANFFYDQTSNRLGLLTTSPTSTLSVGSTSQFQVNSSGNIVKINDVTYSWPSSQGSSNYILTNNGSGTLSWSSPSALVDVSSIAARSSFEDFLLEDLQAHSYMSFVTTTVNGGTGSLEAVAPADNTYTGLVILGTGTSNNATGKSVVSSSGGVNRIFAGGQVVEWRVRVPVLSSSSPRFIVRTGMQSSNIAGESANCVCIMYTDDVNGGQWVGTTRNNSTSTMVNSSIAVAANTWYKLRIEINAAGTSVSFYVNDVLFGTSTTNIPTANAMRLMASIEKGSSSTTSSRLDVDWCLFAASR